MRAEGGNFKLAAWDWRYYAEKVRKAKFDFDEAEIKPYLQLDNVIAAAFDVAGKLFGVSFKRAQGPARLSPGRARLRGARRDGRHVGLFLGDYFARAVEALGRLDVGLARAAASSTASVRADRGQRHELRQGRAGRADAAQLRRRAHAVPRVRPRPARPAVRRDLSERLRAPAWSATSSSCPRSSTSTG